jgi:hypothetical protein
MAQNTPLAPRWERPPLKSQSTAAARATPGDQDQKVLGDWQNLGDKH